MWRWQEETPGTIGGAEGRDGDNRDGELILHAAAIRVSYGCQRMPVGRLGVSREHT